MPALSPSAQSISSARTPAKAAQVCSPMTATALSSRTTSITPGICRAARSLTSRRVPPSTGQARIEAYFMPGTTRSMVKRAVPSTLAGVSRRRVGLPISLN